MDMDISESGLVFISEHEGFSATVYNDVAGNPTIGYGHLITPADGNLTSVTNDEALTLLHNDCAHAVSCVNECVEVDLNQNQFDSLTDFVFNCGGANFQGSTMLKLINQSDFEDAAKEFLKWNHANGVVVQGLTNRRKAEMQLFLTPTNNS